MSACVGVADARVRVWIGVRGCVRVSVKMWAAGVREKVCMCVNVHECVRVHVCIWCTSVGKSACAEGVCRNWCVRVSVVCVSVSARVSERCVCECVSPCTDPPAQIETSRDRPESVSWRKIFSSSAQSDARLCSS